MKIGYDAKRAFKNHTGLGNYSRDLINTFSYKNKKNEILLFTTENSKNNRLDFLDFRKNITVISPKNIFYKKFQSIWRTFRLTKILKQNSIDVFHGLSHEIPYAINQTKIKTVVTIHDLIFLKEPKYFNFIDRVIYYFKTKYACEKSDKIIAISKQTKSDIINLFNIDPNKIEVIYQSCNSIFKKEKITMDNSLGLPKDYILYVSSIVERKNLLSLIKAIKIINKKKLVVIGDGNIYKKKCINYIKKNNLENKVILKSGYNTEEIAIAYRNASIFVYPSLCEGFGIPIIEALYSKVPVITTKGGCFEEAGGNYTKYIDTKNISEIIGAINEIESNPSLRKKMIEKGFSHAKTFNDKTVNKKLNSIYNELLQAK